MVEKIIPMSNGIIIIRDRMNRWGNTPLGIQIINKN